MHNKSSYTISDLSPHLFWDYDLNSLTPETSGSIIIERVLEYGLMSDWRWLVAVYDEKKIIDTALQLKNLSKLSTTFLATLFEVEKEKFACYKNNQSAQSFLNY